ncbi:MAG: YgiT-type zinc finger protein [Longimicrobiales bacterium]|nr:YgiT-type zinc finger protein [Longimicrobiales bacterium]
MICIICHGDSIETTEVREEIRVGQDIVHVLLEVPVCRTCGERYYSRQTMRRLEELETQLKAGELSLTEVGRVLEYG